MKKIASLLILLAAFVSCESDVKFNNPSFQGQKDNFLWRADHTETTKTTIGDKEYLTINAFRGQEQLSLVIPAPTTAIVKTNAQTYTLGVDDKITATYEHTEEGLTLVYKTGKGLGNGQIVINEYDPASKKISGSYRFNAIYQGDNPSVPVNLNFQDGFIYQIQVQ